MTKGELDYSCDILLLYDGMYLYTLISSAMTWYFVYYDDEYYKTPHPQRRKQNFPAWRCAEYRQ